MDGQACPSLGWLHLWVRKIPPCHLLPLQAAVTPGGNADKTGQFSVVSLRSVWDAPLTRLTAGWLEWAPSMLRRNVYFGCFWCFVLHIAPLTYTPMSPSPNLQGDQLISTSGEHSACLLYEGAFNPHRRC